MDLAPSEDQAAIEELFASLLERECPPRVVREAEPLGFSGKLWERLAAAGAAALGVEGAAGGRARLLDLSFAAEPLGAALAPVPFVEHAVASRLLARAAPGDPRLPSLLDGSRVAALAPRPAVDGEARLVPAGAIANLVLALDEGALVAVEGDPPGRAPSNLASSPLADRDLRAGRRAVLASGAAAAELHAHALGEWHALLAAALVGLARAALDLGLAYVKERHQFGVPIGSFQAIQHGLADVAAPLEGARLLARKAAWAFDEEPDRAPGLASMAYLFCGELAQRAAARSLHYHGGYGFSLEYDIQLYYRRAKGWMLALGDPPGEYQRLADHLFGPRRRERG